MAGLLTAFASVLLPLFRFVTVRLEAAALPKSPPAAEDAKLAALIGRYPDAPEAWIEALAARLGSDADVLLSEQGKVPGSAPVDQPLREPALTETPFVSPASPQPPPRPSQETWQEIWQEAWREAKQNQEPLSVAAHTKADRPARPALRFPVTSQADRSERDTAFHQMPPADAAQRHPFRPELSGRQASFQVRFSAPLALDAEARPEQMPVTRAARRSPLIFLPADQMPPSPKAAHVERSATAERVEKPLPQETMASLSKATRHPPVRMFTTRRQTDRLPGVRWPEHAAATRTLNSFPGAWRESSRPDGFPSTPSTDHWPELPEPTPPTPFVDLRDSEHMRLLMRDQVERSWNG
jgi:hypothetical protein